MLPLDSFILGDNPFFGINHHSRQAGESNAQRFQDTTQIIHVIRLARQAGFQGIMLSAHDQSRDILRLLQDDIELRDFHVYPNIPYLMKYVQRATQEGLLGTLQHLLTQGTAQKGLAAVASLLAGGIGFVKKDFKRMMETAIELELAPYDAMPTPAIFLHNGIVDLILGLGCLELLEYYDDRVRKKYDSRPGFGTLNLPLCLKSLQSIGLKRPLIMAPFNKKGFHMNPSRESCEKVLTHEDFDFFAMNVLVSGALPAEEAFEYLKEFPSIRHIIVGASSEKNIKSSLALLKKVVLH